MPLFLLALVVLLHLPAVGAAVTLQKLPLGERWYSIRMQGELVGFSRLAITESQDGYELRAESSAHMVVLGFTREAAAREHYVLHNDFSLKSFAVEQVIDRSPLNLTGTVTAKGISVTVTAAGVRKEQLLVAKMPVYPPAMINLYPLIKGPATKKKYTLQMFDPESVEIKSVTVTAVGTETFNGTPVYHFRNNLYPFVDNDVWVDVAGNTLRESVRNGLIETKEEPESVVRQALLAAAVAQKDLVLDFSRIHLEKPLERPNQLSRLVIELTGYPDGIPIVSGPGQSVVRLPGDVIRFTREHELAVSLPVPAPSLLQPTTRIQSDNPELIARLAEAGGKESDPRRRIEKLASWVASAVKDTVGDGQTALDTLRTLEGNCVSHARLFVTLARAAGLPSRMVVGLVYTPARGFLYHAWAEVYAGQWLAIDPTFNQVPADLTHLKLAEGETVDDFAALAGVVGRLSARVVETTYAEKRNVQP